jgi:hypothetical protein
MGQPKNGAAYKYVLSEISDFFPSHREHSDVSKNLGVSSGDPGTNFFLEIYHSLGTHI